MPLVDVTLSWAFETQQKFWYMTELQSTSSAKCITMKPCFFPFWGPFTNYSTYLIPALTGNRLWFWCFILSAIFFQFSQVRSTESTENPWTTASNIGTRTEAFDKSAVVQKWSLHRCSASAAVAVISCKSSLRRTFTATVLNVLIEWLFDLLWLLSDVKAFVICALTQFFVMIKQRP